MKTGNEIEEDFFVAIQNTALAKAINGSVYRSDYRPRNSSYEDIVVRFTAVSSGQTQEGVVTVLVYVPDVDVNGIGNKKRNSSRLLELEKKADEMLTELSSMQELHQYDDIGLQTGIQSYPDSQEQHFVSIKISFKYLTD